MKAFRKIIQSVAYRTTKRYNVLKIRDLPANYWDKDTILLYAVMQLVVDFVEIECAFMELDVPYTLRQRINFKLPWFLRSDEVYRNRELGLQRLTGLEEAYQDMGENSSDAPKAIREVYLWWKDVRPLRIDTSEELAQYRQQCFDLGRTPDKKTIDKFAKKSIRIEEKHFKEDTEMLNKIIKYRSFMWT